MHFSGNAARKNIDIACLHLAFYLASWGMYRGSSFLLWKDYRIHTVVVEKLLKNRHLQKIDVLNINDEQILEIINLTQWVKNWYKENIKTVRGTAKTVNVTDTLATKIMLGTLACIPAYDRYFIDGMRKSGISYSKINRNNLIAVINFYRKNQAAFIKAQKTIQKQNGVTYPPMKLLDMYFWQVGSLA